MYTGWLAGDLGAGCPGAETGHEVVARLAAVLDDLRDLHRGETVVLVTHGGVMTVAAARLCRGAPPDLAGSAGAELRRRGGRGRLRRVGPRQLARGARQARADSSARTSSAQPHDSVMPAPPWP